MENKVKLLALSFFLILFLQGVVFADYPSPTQEPIHNPAILSFTASDSMVRSGSVVGGCSSCGGGCKGRSSANGIGMPTMPLTDVPRGDRFQEGSTQHPFTPKNYDCPKCDENLRHPTTAPCDDCGMRGTSVYLNSGEFYHTAVDIEIPGVGFPFQLVRRYKSGITYDGPLGNKWEFNYNMRVAEQENDDVYFYDGRGRRDTFSWDEGNSKYNSPDGFYAEMRKDVGTGEFTIRQWNGTVYTFEGDSENPACGKLLSIEDRSANAMTFQYDGNGKLTKAVDTRGKEVTFSWDQAGTYLDKITDDDGREVDFTVDDGDLVAVEDPEGNVTEYTYDEEHNLLTIENPNGDVYWTNEYTDDQVTTVRYGVSAQSVSISYDPNDCYTQETNRNGNVIEWYYDSSGNLTKKVEDPNGGNHITTYEYNSQMELTKITFPESNWITYTYASGNADPKARGNLLTETRSFGGTSVGTTLTYATHTENQENFYYFVSTVVNGCCNGTTTYCYDFQETEEHDCNGDGTYDAHKGDLVSISHPPVSSPVEQTIVDEFFYNSSGQCTKYVAPEGDATAYEYHASGDGVGLLKKITRDSGQLGLNASTQFEYNAYGNVTKITDPNSHDYGYESDAVNRVTKITLPVADSNSFAKYYYYDANGNLTKSEVDNKDETGTTRAWAAVPTEYSYDNLNNLTSLKKYIASATTVTTSYYLDKDENITKQLLPAGNTIEYTYDARDLLITKTTGADDANRKSPESFQYDGNRNLTKHIDGESNATSYYYDDLERKTKATDPLSNAAVWEYDDYGNVTKVTSKNSSGTVLEGISFDYDEVNRKYHEARDYFTTDPENPVRVNNQYYHDQNGNLTKTALDTAVRDRETAFEYDGLGRLTREISPDSSKKEYNYDSRGDLTKLVERERFDPGEAHYQVITTSYEYDYLGRRTKVIRDPGEGNLNLTTKYYHDSRSDLVKVTDGKGNNTAFEYDGLDRKTKVDQDYLDSGNTLLTTKYEYDGNSRVTKVIDDNDHATTFAYDSLNRPTNETLADSGAYSYEYDKANNVTKRTDPIGTVVGYLYDDSNRLTKKNITKGTGVGGATYEEFQYDGLSRITKTLDDDSIVTLKYDSFSHVYETSQSVDNPASVTRTVKYEFDHEGNVTKLTYPDDGVLQVVPDDNINRIKQLKSGNDIIAAYTYVGPGGRVLQRDYLNGIKAQRTYDAARRLLTLEHRDGKTLKFGFNYAYDDNDNGLYEEQTHRQGRGDVYSYDKINQIATVKYNVNDPSSDPTNPSMIEDFRYDGVWNRTKVIKDQSTETTYTVNNVNEYTQVGNSSQTFDDNGNLHTSDLHGQSLTVTYDYDNRPTRMVYGETTVDFKYDPFGRKIEKKVGEAVLRYFYDDKKVLEEIDDGHSPNISSKYVYGPGIDEVLVVQHKMSGVLTPFYCHENALGSIVALTRSTKETVEEYAYDVYGRVYTDYTRSTLRTSSSVANPYFFTGRRLDFETGTYDYRARYYDPWQGRFMQRDPYYMGQVKRLTGRMPCNLYYYVYNNPINVTDPFGLVATNIPSLARVYRVTDWNLCKPLNNVQVTDRPAYDLRGEEPLEVECIEDLFLERRETG